MKKILFVFITLLVSLNSIVQAQDCLWAKGVGGYKNEEGNCVSTDANGNIYVAGLFNSHSITFGTNTLIYSDSTAIINSYRDIFIVKYDSNGQVIWATSAGEACYTVVSGIATDASGNVYVTGGFQSPTITFGTTTLFNVDNSRYHLDIFIVKYAPDGTALWARSAGSTYHDRSNIITTDNSGNLYITGSFAGPTITLGSTTLTYTYSGGSDDDFLLAKYANDGTVL